MARDIVIYRDLPVVNGYVETGAPESRKQRVNVEDAQSLIDTNMNSTPDSGLKHIVGASGMITKYGASKGRDSFLRLPGIEPGEWYRNKSGASIDPVDLVD